MANFVAKRGPQLVASGALYRKRTSKAAAIFKWLRQGNSVDAHEPSGTTLLHWLASEGNVDGAKVLLDHGAAIDPVNGLGMTPLLLALNTDNGDVAAMLLDRGASATARAKDGRTTVHCVFSWNLVTRRLLAAGADPTLEDERGVTAIGRMSPAEGKEAASHQVEIVALMKAAAPTRRQDPCKQPDKAPRERPQRKKAKWELACAEIWKTLVPPRGQSDTVQGELLRAVEKLRDEALRNGNINWNKNHRRLHRYIGRTLRASGVLSRSQLSQLSADLALIGDIDHPPRSDAPYDRLCQLVAYHHAKHPEPIPRERDAALEI